MTASALPLQEIAQRARKQYLALLTGQGHDAGWWSAVIITASSQRQAERYQSEIDRRRREGKLPPGAIYLVVPDVGDRRIGTAGATLNALRSYAGLRLPDLPVGSLQQWWERERVLIIHSGGDSRRLPEYSLAGKLFTPLPVKSPWGEISTVFDETMALSTGWVSRLRSGLVVASGDVVLTFPPELLEWEREGVCGVAIRQPVEVGTQHGVYVLDSTGRVYTFLQKPTLAEVRAAGGLLEQDTVAVDTGLMRFDPRVAAALTELAGVRRAGDRWCLGKGLLEEFGELPVIDLYQHVAECLAGQWTPTRDDHPALVRLAERLRGTPFSCCLVEGEFTHVGTTAHFLELMTQHSPFLELYDVHQRHRGELPPGVRGHGVVVDSVLAPGTELGPGCLVIECNLAVPVRVGRAAILHGVEGLATPLELPEGIVLHQVPLRLGDRRAVVFRVYGVQDDPKQSATSSRATWMGEPLIEALARRGLDPEDVWPGIPLPERTLWNARLFVAGPLEEALACAQWFLGVSQQWDPGRWRAAARVSLAESSAWADAQMLAEARQRRVETAWQRACIELAQADADIRPLLVRAPSLSALAAVGQQLEASACQVEETHPTQAASRCAQASLVYRQAGLEDQATSCWTRAFHLVRRAVEAGAPVDPFPPATSWQYREVTVAAPARIDFGGGWSDTPPFCLDWGGTVLNAAVVLDGSYPIRTRVQVVPQPLIRIHAEGQVIEFRRANEMPRQLAPGSPWALPITALELAGITGPGVDWQKRLEAMGGGLDIELEVNLPMGSGLGTSSILAAALLQGLAELAGRSPSPAELSDQVMCLEQRLTTGGGWQDQAGGIFPGVKLLSTAPGFVQRLRVQPITLAPSHKQEFLERFLLYYTGIQRIARELLAQIVGAYLERRAAVVQVLHSIKTLALEMSYAMREGQWDQLGALMDRHWQLNQVLDPHTTNAPIEALLDQIRPYAAGAKLAGAGGGGFLMIVARGPEEASRIRQRLQATTGGARFYDVDFAETGLLVTRQP